MRNEREISIDALLHDIARQQNAALPLDDWKQEILKKAQANVAPGVEPPAFDELAARRRRKSLRRMTLGLGTAAAALLILLSTRSLWQGGIGMKNAARASEVPAEDRLYEMGAPMQESTEAPMGIMSMPEGATEAPAPQEPAAPAPAAEPAADSAGGATPGTESGINENRLGGAFTEEETKVLLAVLAATAPDNGDTAVYDSAFTEITRLEPASLTVQPLDGGAQQTIGREVLYRVVLDTSVQDAPAYAVDAQTFEVLGKIIE